MNQISSYPNNHPVIGAGFMVGAGVTFAAVNTLTPIITYQLGVPSTAVVFWQYVIATVFALPLIYRIGFAALKTRHPVLHEVRAFVSALGVQFWAFGFATGVPLWQMIALSMTAPSTTASCCCSTVPVARTSPKMCARFRRKTPAGSE